MTIVTGGGGWLYIPGAQPIHVDNFKLEFEPVDPPPFEDLKIVLGTVEIDVEEP